MVRKYLLDGTPREKGRGEWVEVDWETALDLTANKLRFARDTYGPDSVGVLDLGQMPQRRKLPDEQVCPPGGRDKQYRSLRPSLTLQHRGRSGHFLRLGRYVQLDG
jgi:hypothetical protein